VLVDHLRVEHPDAVDGDEQHQRVGHRIERRPELRLEREGPGDPAVDDVAQQRRNQHPRERNALRLECEHQQHGHRERAGTAQHVRRVPEPG